MKKFTQKWMLIGYFTVFNIIALSCGGKKDPSKQQNNSKTKQQQNKTKQN